MLLSSRATGQLSHLTSSAKLPLLIGDRESEGAQKKYHVLVDFGLNRRYIPYVSLPSGKAVPSEICSNEYSLRTL